MELVLKTACFDLPMRLHCAVSCLAETIDFLLEQAARRPLLTAQQEIELGRLIRAWQDHPDGPDQAPPAVQRRGRRALQRFLESNLRLAHYVARRYANRGVPIEDLMQAAAEGLLTAYKRFKPAMGYRSSSYAVWWAQQSCQQLVAQQGTGLRLPTTVSEQLRKVTKATAALTQRLGREPTHSEIEEAAGLRPGQLLELRDGARRADVRSLDAAITGDSLTLMDVAGSGDPQGDLERQDQHRQIRELVATTSALTPQQRVLIECRYLCDNPPSIAKLASQLHMNRETLRRMEKQALRILKSVLPGGIAA